MSNREYQLEQALRALVAPITDLPDQSDCAARLEVTDKGDGGRGHRVRYIHKSDVVRAKRALENQ